MVGFVNRDTEVLKERKGSRGYQGWTDWMPRAHWYGITLPCLHGRFGLPHVCGSCLRASPAALHTLAPSIQSPLPAASLCRHQRSPCPPLCMRSLPGCFLGFLLQLLQKHITLMWAIPQHLKPALLHPILPFRTARRQICHQREN